MIDPVLEKRIKKLIETQAAFGIRSVWAWLRFVDGLQINRKKVERIMRLKRWTLKARRAGQRPRVQVSRSIAEAPNQRWATDIALVHCGIDGWCAMVPVIDCCSRQDRRAGLRRSPCLTASAGCMALLPGLPCATTMASPLAHASTAPPCDATASNKSTSLLIPPEQNGLCEGFIRTLKEQCVWLHRFTSLQLARSVIDRWINQYNTIRPHQALDYLSLTKYLDSLLCTQQAA